jgi:hypothetical protein
MYACMNLCRRLVSMCAWTCVDGWYVCVHELMHMYCARVQCKVPVVMCKCESHSVDDCYVYTQYMWVCLYACLCCFFSRQRANLFFFACRQDGKIRTRVCGWRAFWRCTRHRHDVSSSVAGLGGNANIYIYTCKHDLNLAVVIHMHSHIYMQINACNWVAGALLGPRVHASWAYMKHAL